MSRNHPQSDRHPPHQPTAKWFRSAWGGVVLVLGAGGTIYAGVANWTKLYELCCKLPRKPQVSVRVEPQQWGGQCLAFVFSNLPRDFQLGNIELAIAAITGPSAYSGAQAAKIFEVDVQQAINEEDLATNRLKQLVVKANIAATKDDDAAAISFCPTITQPGTSAELLVTPRFLSLDGRSPIKDLTVDGLDKNSQLKVVECPPRMRHKNKGQFSRGNDVQTKAPCL